MKKFVKKHFSLPLILKISLFLVVVLRLYLFLFPSFKIDMGDWQAWALRIVNVGPTNFYTPGMLADYLPFFYLLLFVFTKIFVLIFGNPAILTSSFDIYMRLISNGFDFLTAYVIFLIVKKYNPKWAFLSAILYLLNPGVMFNSSVWGQTDSIPTFFFLLGIYQLNEAKSVEKSAIFSILSVLVKPLNVSGFPVMAIRAIKNYPVKRIFISVVSAFVIFLVLTIPFFIKDPVLGIFGHLFNSLSVYPYTSLNAYNFWGLLTGWWKTDSTLFWGISYHAWGYILFFFAVFAILTPYLRVKKSRMEIDYFAMMLSSFAFFLFLTRIHERHLFPIFSLLIIAAFVFRSRILLASYVIISVIHFFNLFYSYYYYNFVYSNYPAANNMLFKISSEWASPFSFVLISVFFIMLVAYYKTLRALLKK
jgi:Gpi18-like mannosyltransferase